MASQKIELNDTGNSQTQLPVLRGERGGCHVSTAVGFLFLMLSVAVVVGVGVIVHFAGASREVVCKCHPDAVLSGQVTQCRKLVRMGLTEICQDSTELKTDHPKKMTNVTTITKEDFGKTKDGEKVTRYTLTNSKGANVKILDLGGILNEINIPDKNGTFGDVTLGFDQVEDYEDKPGYLGALIGRFANRIAGGQFTLDGKTYNLFINNGPNSLHGGKIGFNKKIWEVTEQNGSLVLRYVSADGEENYPGQLTVTVTYTFDEDNKLTIEYHASTDKATPINLTNHAYFNLAGHGTGHIKDHIVTLYAENYLPLDENMIPTGEIRPVNGSEFDLRTPVTLGERLDKVPGGKGFDNNFCLDNNGKFELVTRVDHPPSGRYLEVFTDEPGMQFYTSFWMSSMTGKGGAAYGQFGAFCLEAQHYPDSVNKPQFPNTILRPGQFYTQTTAYKFGLL
ncbi:hypothetical protein Btru_041352 [Bulinus truncatus]|nr:hypothetical protein Btru_041352 [Bulinus truncatus]